MKYFKIFTRYFLTSPEKILKNYELTRQMFLLVSIYFLSKCELIRNFKKIYKISSYTDSHKGGSLLSEGVKAKAKMLMAMCLRTSLRFVLFTNYQEYIARM